MGKKFVLYFVLIIVFNSCGFSDKQESSLPCIDIRKNYPEKEIILTDIADVSYLCLNSDDDEYLYNGVIHSVTKNTIVILDSKSGKILLFSKDGKPKSQFNRKGNGPEDYLSPAKVVYDEEKDDVFVYSIRSDVKVYSSSGEYKRKIVFPQEAIPNSFISFDEESLFFYDSSIELVPDKKRETTEETDYPTQYYSYPFVRISKIDGKVLDYVELPINNIELKAYIDDGFFTHIKTSRVISCSKGLFLCNPETDTVFLYGKDKTLNPVLCKTPLVSTLDPMIVLNNCMEGGGYQFLQIATVQYVKDASPPFPVKYIMRDTKTGKVFSQKILLPDYKGKDFFINSNASGKFYEEGTYFELELIELKQAYDENKLSGKLKELVETINENEDNNIIMFVDFK